MIELTLCIEIFYDLKNLETKAEENRDAMVPIFERIIRDREFFEKFAFVGMRTSHISLCMRYPVWDNMEHLLGEFDRLYDIAQGYIPEDKEEKYEIRPAMGVVTGPSTASPLFFKHSLTRSNFYELVVEVQKTISMLTDRLPELARKPRAIHSQLQALAEEDGFKAIRPK